MRVYVAGRTNMILAVRRVQRIVQSAGHEITYDWTVNVEAEGGSAREKFIPRERQIGYANSDRWGVLTSDLTIVVAGPQLTGTLIECGLALAFCGEIQVILYGKPEREAVFFELPEVKRITTEDALISELDNLRRHGSTIRLQRPLPSLREGGLRSYRELSPDSPVAGRNPQSPGHGS